jgi:acetolactate synthase-1/2/3 large subunit
MRAADALFEALKAEGVEHIFGIPGGANLPTYDALYDAELTHIQARHEQGAGHAAEGYAKASGRVGVALATSGPGATNLVTAIADAFLDRAPLDALTGQADLQRMHKESHQHIDIVSMFKPVTKWNTRLNAAGVIPEVVRKAFKVAQEPKPGPTHIELP